MGDPDAGANTEKQIHTMLKPLFGVVCYSIAALVLFAVLAGAGILFSLAGSVVSWLAGWIPLLAVIAGIAAFSLSRHSA